MPRGKKRYRKKRIQKGGGEMTETALQRKEIHSDGGMSLIPKNDKVNKNRKKLKELTGKASSFIMNLGFHGMVLIAGFITAVIFFIIALTKIDSGDSSQDLMTTYIILLTITILMFGFYISILLKKTDGLKQISALISPAFSVIASLAFVLSLNTDFGSQLSIILKYVPAINAANILLAAASLYQVNLLWKFFESWKKGGMNTITGKTIGMFVFLFILIFGLTVTVKTKIRAYTTSCKD